ncbi:S8 family serine peptidase [Hymenobacter edaphi]|uniref:S8 family serine peptidase n=1 Tax=Hymenobacter edaphi TaxID=2211146 RepID=UPI001FB344EA|nr:S8 family serine peptidase [Hymenobacter edaphi]
MLLPAALLSSVHAQTPGGRAAPATKLAPPLQLAPLAAAYRVQVPDAAAFRRWARQHLPAARLTAAPGPAGLFTVHGASSAAALAACPLVEFVDVADRRAQPEKEIDGVDLGANRVWPVHALFPQLDGRGLTASVKEEPFDSADIDFHGRVLPSALLGGQPSDHATIMATLIGGAGNSAPTGRGAAGQVRLASSSYANLLPDDGAQLSAAGVSVQNHSYGVAAVESYYGLEARAYDQQTRQYPALLHVFSSGNRGTQTSPAGSRYAAVAGVANLTGQFKQSKNTLSVGATDVLGQVAPLSSRGPAHDGRLKPELVALGEAGTSDAAALVSGAALLAQHAYRDQHAGVLPPAALTKAVLLNSADDVGRPGPDFEAGFGQTDALGAVQTMLAGRVLLDAVGAGATSSFPLAVPAGVRQLKLTLVWADAEAAANAAQALVNDLDVELVGPGGQRWRPWVLSAYAHPDSLRLPARRGADHLNNVEQITLAVPAAGTYQVQVRGYRLAVGSSQDFAVAYELETAGLDWTNPASTGTALRADQPQRLRWQWRGPAATGRLEYRLGSTGSWQLIGAAVDVAAGLYLWTPPDVAGAAQVRLVVGSTEYPSGAFALSRRPQPEVGYYCPSEGSVAAEALLTWPPVPGVSEYQILRLGATRLEPFRVVADTALLLSGAALGSRYYGVVPLLPDGTPAARARTLDYTRSGTGCYVRSFLPRQLVSSEVQFELVLGTTYRLRRIYLERQTAAGFETVQTLTPGPQPRFWLTDVPPGPGRYAYRAHLETQAGRSIYTGIEEAYFAAVGDVAVFPNPVAAGQPITVLDAEQRLLHWQLFDHLGRLLREASTDEGTLGQVPTDGLHPGTYVLRLRPAGGGASFTRRVLVR